MAEELPSVIVQPSTLTSAPSRGQREQPLMIRSTLSSPMMTTGVVPGRVVSRVGVRLEVMAVVEREVFDDPIDDVVRRRRVGPQASRQAPEQRKQLAGHHVRGGRQFVACSSEAGTVEHGIFVPDDVSRYGIADDEAGAELLMAQFAN